MTPEELERQLGAIQFVPRASLEAEVLGRAARGDAPRRFPSPNRFRQALMGVAAVLVAGAMIYAAWQRARQPAVTVDRCCQDLDGGGAPDDGVLIVSTGGSAIRDLRIYEDHDGSRDFSEGDEVRFLRGDRLLVSGSVNGSETREFCCLDYDGGGASDDALVVMGSAPDHITMAAIYEHAQGADAQLR